MNNPLNRINNALKAKEDRQSFVLIALILFLLFVKCYMLVVDPVATNTVESQPKTDKVKPNTILHS